MALYSAPGVWDVRRAGLGWLGLAKIDVDRPIFCVRGRDVRSSSLCSPRRAARRRGDDLARQPVAVRRFLRGRALALR